MCKRQASIQKKKESHFKCVRLRTLRVYYATAHTQNANSS